MLHMGGTLVEGKYFHHSALQFRAESDAVSFGLGFYFWEHNSPEGRGDVVY